MLIDKPKSVLNNETPNVVKEEEEKKVVSKTNDKTSDTVGTQEEVKTTDTSLDLENKLVKDGKSKSKKKRKRSKHKHSDELEEKGKETSETNKVAKTKKPEQHSQKRRFSDKPT